jgi:chromosome segregation ATPase
MQAMQNLDQIWFLVGAFLLGFLLAWLILPFFLRRNASRYEEQIESIQTTLRRREQDLISVRNQLDRKSDDLQSLQSNHGALAANLETTQAELDAATLALEETQAAYSEAVTDRTILEAERTENASELSALRAASTDAYSKLTVAEESLATIETALVATSEELAAAGEELAVAEAALVDKREEIDMLAAKVQLLQETNLALETTLADQLTNQTPEAISGEVEGLDDGLDEDEPYLTARMSMTLQEDEKFEDALWQRELDLVEARDEINYLRASLSALTAISAELAGNIDKRNQDYGEMVAQLADFLADEGDEESLAMLTGDVTETSAPTDTEDMQVHRLVALSDAALQEELAGEKPALSFDELRRLTLRLEAYKRDTARYQRELEGALAAKAALETEFLSREEELEKISQQMAGLETRLESVNGDLEGMNVEFTKRNQDLRAARNELAAMGPELNEAVERRAALEAEAAQRDGELTELKQEYATLQTEKSTLESSLAARVEELTALRAQFDSQTEAMDALQNSVASAQTELDQALAALLNEGPDETVDDTDAANAVRSVAQDLGEPTQLTAGILAVKTELASLHDELDARDLALAETQDQLDAVTVARSALENDLSDLQANSSAIAATLTAEITEKEAQIEALTAEKAQLEAQGADLQEQVASLQSALTEVEAAKAEAEAQLATLEENIAAVRSQLVDALGADAQSSDLDVEALRAGGASDDDVNLKLLTAGSAAVIKKVGDQQTSLEEANGRVSELEGALNEREQALDNAQTQLDELIQSRMALNEQITELTTEKSELEATIAQRENALQAATAQAATLSDGRRELEASINGLRAELAALQVDKDDLLTGLQEAETARLAAETELAEKARIFDGAPAMAELASEIEAYPAIKRYAANEALRMRAIPVFGAVPQDLTEIKGIGSAFQQRLYDAGVGTYWELANLPDDEIRQVLELTDWQLRSVSFDEIREDALHLAESTDTIGKLWNNLERIDDFEPIPGIGRVFERRLYDAGIYTYEQLASATVEQLAAACHAPKLHVPDYAAWIEEAKVRMVQDND